MYRSPRPALVILLPLALLLSLPTFSACATPSNAGAQSEASDTKPTRKRPRFYDPWGQPYEENTPDDSPPPVEYEESDDL